MGPAAGSRMTFMAGNTLINGLEQLKKAMKEAGSKTYEGLKKAGKPTRYEAAFNTGPGSRPNMVTGQGPSFVSEVQNIQMAEVEVNTETGEARVVKMTTAVDAGPIINPNNLTGQLDGGMDQGVGYALREEYITGKTKDWVTFRFPTINNTFETEIYTRETPRPNGPLGATGIGEMTMVSTAPAVINAIKNACGARVYALPATPEKGESGAGRGEIAGQRASLHGRSAGIVLSSVSADRTFFPENGKGVPGTWRSPERRRCARLNNMHVLGTSGMSCSPESFRRQGPDGGEPEA
jgi:aldehyde oxidoreductase